MGFISLKDVSKSFGAIKAVDNVTLEMEKGEVFGLLGPNGAGKSTLILMMIALLSSDSGEIEINGLNIKKHAGNVKKLIGYVPQEIALYTSLTARENLVFWGRMYGLKGRNLARKVDETLEISGLTGRAKSRLETYSGGMKRRINIAAAIMHHPEILIMDEPTVGIDPQSRNHILETVLKLNKKGVTVVYTSHYMEEVEFLCSRVAIMDCGKIIAIGNKDELRRMISNKDTINIGVQNTNEKIRDELNTLPGVESVWVEENNIRIIASDADTVLARVISVIDSGKSRIRFINIEEPNLESVFLHLTGKALRD
ncbi:MAG: ABC transporter ATP-binding protein [Acetivibrionales bacterium]|jgi:ABC-2 type transport system ATP-binding protein